MTEKTNLSPALAVGVIVCILAAFFVGRSSVGVASHTLTKTTTQTTTSSEAALLAKVATLTALPNETPLIAVVKNEQAVRNLQSFFKDTQTGDILIAYSKARVAILYRETTNQIINQGSIENKTQGTGSVKSATSTSATTTRTR